MLKISLVDGQRQRRLIVEGTLVAPRASELAIACEKATESLEGRELVVDLRGLTRIGPEGEHALLQLMKNKIKIKTKFQCGVFVRELLRQLVRGTQPNAQDAPDAQMAGIQKAESNVNPSSDSSNFRRLDDDSLDTFILVPMLRMCRNPIFNRLPEAESWQADCLPARAGGPPTTMEVEMSTTTETTLHRADLASDAAPKPRPVLNNVSAKRLAGKIAVITGGSTGMGLATAKRFVLEGADHVFITGRRKDALESAVAEIGEKVTGVPGDVASLRDLDRLYESVDGYGRKIDVVFANAGISQIAALGTVDEKFFDLHFDANVKGLFFTVQKALPLLKDGASIILNASIATIKGFPGISVYSATKAAVRSFARTWTNELRERHIRVNAISPGHIDTPIFESWQKGEALRQLKEELAKNVPLGRLGDPDEIAKAVAFLASDEASYISGIELFVDGGVAQI